MTWWKTALRVAGHESRLLAADRSLRGVLLLLVALAAYGLANGSAKAVARSQALAGVRSEESRRLSELKGRLDAIERDPARPVSRLDDPRSAAAVGQSSAASYAILPPGPLAALSIGQADLLPSYVKVTTGGKQALHQDEEVENPNHLLSGRVDLEFVVVALYPLAILALSFNLLSSEKEGGTLTLLLSQPVGLGAIALGKVAMRALLAAVLAAGVTLLGRATVATSAHTSWEPWAWWLGIVLAYGGFWFALAVAVNALGRPSATNALILASAWLGLVLVVPALVNLAASAWYPVPSRVELVQATREATTRANGQGTRLLSKFYEGHPELAPGGASAVDDFQVRAFAVQDSIEKALEPVLRRFDMQLERQRGVVRLARFLSPSILAQEALQDVAGTGRGRHDDFLAQVADFQSRWLAFFQARIVRKQHFTTADLATLPVFEFREEPPGAVAARASVGLAGILAPTFLVGALGLRALRRYPVVG